MALAQDELGLGVPGKFPLTERSGLKVIQETLGIIAQCIEFSHLLEIMIERLGTQSR